MEPRQPIYPEVLVRPNVRVPMRDGIELVTDIYLPAREGKVVAPQPALLLRTPYNKGDSNSAQAMRWARHGYVVAAQDVRGRYASDGVFTAFVQEDLDGHDAIEWLAALPECDGRVGTWGGSYCAASQGAAATQRPPHLAAMCHYFGYPHKYHVLRQGGALDVFYISYMVYMAGDGKEAQADASVKQALYDMRFEEWLERWPLQRGRSPLALAPSYEDLSFELINREALDDFWLHPALAPAAHLDLWPDVPTLHICGWYDHYAYAHPDTLVFTRLIERGHQNQYLVFGPWTHGNVGRKIGETDFGEAAELSTLIPDYELRWFDRWLKGVDDNGAFPARAQYFVMGGGTGARTGDGLLDHGGEWATADLWPPRADETRQLHLAPDGVLTATPPNVGPTTTSYHSDPDNPVPSSTGVCYTSTRLREGGTRRLSTNGAWNQVEGPHLHGCTPPFLPLAARPDVLVFQTEPLAEDLIVAGHPVVELWISSDAPDTDFIAKLIDVYPSNAENPGGFALGVSEGVQRAKFRNGLEQAELLTPGEVALVRILLRPLANRFLKGHRLRLDIASSSWPHFDVNTQTGRNPSTDYDRRVAVNTIHHSRQYPSRLVLPTVRTEREGA
ncbi:MAG TPA: antibiotic hydrolase [Armatimonadetes bacterium]|nr:antibiotic hydrolase [Armatimonadota bacterium]